MATHSPMSMLGRLEKLMRYHEHTAAALKTTITLLENHGAAVDNGRGGRIEVIGPVVPAPAAPVTRNWKPW